MPCLDLSMKHLFAIPSQNNTFISLVFFLIRIKSIVCLRVLAVQVLAVMKC